MSSENDIPVEAHLPVEPARAAQFLFYGIAVFFVLTLIWASTARLDRVTRGAGRVVPSNQLQEVQYLEGGIVSSILVAAGDDVKSGDLLVRLDPTQMNADFFQGRDGYNLLSARITRLEARTQRKPLIFAPELTINAAGIVYNERRLFEARSEEIEAALSVEQSKFAQRQESLQEATVALEYAQESLALAREETALMRPLVAKGIEPKIELIRARQRESTARGEVQRSEIIIERTKLEVAEAENELTRVEKTFLATAVDELTKAKAEFSDLAGELPALQDKVARTDVKSPIDGVVNRVLVATVGGVVQPGETIVEIVPNNDTPLVEAKIVPADIGFLHVGQNARVKLTAYDSSIYGSLDGVIETISPDVILDDETGDRHYLITVRTTDSALRTKKGELQIMPGMSADVEILNGKRSVLTYILKPLAQIGDKALREE